MESKYFRVMLGFMVAIHGKGLTLYRGDFMNSKKILVLLVMLASACQQVSARRGGSAVAGALGGLMVGTMIGTAASKSDSRTARTDDKIDQLQREQDNRRVEDLQREMDKREIERKIEEQRAKTMEQEKEKSSTLLYVLLAVIMFMFLAIAGLGIMLVNMRKKD